MKPFCFGTHTQKEFAFQSTLSTWMRTLSVNIDFFNSISSSFPCHVPFSYSCCAHVKSWLVVGTGKSNGIYEPDGLKGEFKSLNALIQEFWCVHKYTEKEREIGRQQEGSQEQLVEKQSSMSLRRERVSLNRVIAAVCVCVRIDGEIAFGRSQVK